MIKLLNDVKLLCFITSNSTYNSNSMYSMYNNSAAAHAYLILRYDLKVSIKLQYNLVIIILEIYHPVGSYPDRIERLSLIRIVNNSQI